MRLLLVLCLLVSLSSFSGEKTVVLTFDDFVKSQAAYVAPLLKKHGFNATFFITEGFSFNTRKDLYMTWKEIKKLHDMGFEIGNHTRHHKMVNKMKPEELDASLEYIEKRCAEHGIPKPVSFCYPAYATTPEAVKVLKKRGYKFARCGGERASNPSKENLLLLPQAFDSKPGKTFEQFVAAVNKADKDHVPIITFHGVPDVEHPWVDTKPDQFLKYINYLKEKGFKVIALRDYPVVKK